MNNLYLEESAEHGRDCGRGNLLGIQPFMTPADYASEETFCVKIDGYLGVAAQRDWLDERTIVVLPEYVGTWLTAAGEKQQVYQAQNLTGAMRTLALGHVFPLARALLATREKDKMAASLFRVKAAQTARIYQSVFSGLARKYGVTIVAGSILLPSPRVVDGVLVAGSGALYNTSVVYKPDGSAYDRLARKAFPTTAELPFVTPAPVAELPAFDTPAGRLGVLVCADSWYPAPYERLKVQGVELIAVPSYIQVNDVWDKPWGGYNGAPAPDDVDLGDVGALTEGQAWRKYALAGRIAQAGARYGINVFLRGALWDLGADGYTTVVDGQTVNEVAHEGAALINLWLS